MCIFYTDFCVNYNYKQKSDKYIKTKACEVKINENVRMFAYTRIDRTQNSFRLSKKNQHWNDGCLKRRDRNTTVFVFY